MKELSIEEKAKAYDEAIKKGKQILNTPYTAHWDIMKEIVEHLLPKLKESEDERIRKRIIHALHGDVLEMSEIKEAVAWLEKQSKDSPVLSNSSNTGKYSWSEEDEEISSAIIKRLKGSDALSVDLQRAICWIDHVKDRVQPQPRQECSEEEIEKASQEWDSKANFNPFYMIMDGDKPTDVKQDITTHKESFKAGVNWILKSIKPQKQWKPSKGQMMAIDTAINVLGKGTLNGKQLIELQEQLKKLRDE